MWFGGLGLRPPEYSAASESVVLQDCWRRALKYRLEGLAKVARDLGVTSASGLTRIVKVYVLQL